jgi:ribosome maturation factor RimP
MDNILSKIRELITPSMESMGLIVDSVTWENVDKYNYLKIVLDKNDYIDIDTIVEATNKINPILDEYDLIEEEYILDVSSKERG